MCTPKREIYLSGLILCLCLTVAVVLAASDPPFPFQEQLIASDGSTRDHFGTSVALDGVTAVVGAPGWVKDDQFYFGTVYVYTRDARGRRESAQIIHDDGRLGDIFGNSVALDDGTLAVSAMYRDVLTPTRVSNVGAVVVYTGAAETWTKQALLMPDDLVGENVFGHDVDVDGDTLIAGAPNLESSSNEAAYIYRRNGSDWTLEDKLTAPGSPADFGAAVAINDDVALVGAPGYGQDGSTTPLAPGIVYLFERSGGEWNPAGTLIPNESEAGDNFGCTMDFDGQTAVIVACEAYGTPPDPGEAYVFVRNGSTWTPQARLTPDVDGYPLDLSSAGLHDDRLALGADRAPRPGELGTSPGAVFVYERNGEEWTAVQTIYADDGQDADAFGMSLSLGGDELLVGAPSNSVLNVPEQGSAYVFGPNSGTVAPTQLYLPIVVGRPSAPVQPGSDDTILYTSSDNSGGGIYAIQANGSNRMRLSPTERSDYSPRWSPDRRQIAFISSLPSSAAQLMVMNADGSDPRVILTPKLDMMGSLSWSPDGVSIAFNAYTKNTKWDIYRVGIDGSGLTNLTADMARNTADPDWSPDGKHIVFVHGGNGYPTDLWLMDADGSNRINLTNDDEGQYYPAWSPDGRTILFARDGAGFNKEELVTMPATGGATTPVIAIGIWGRWSPDGRRIVFAGVDGGIFRVNVDGTSLTALDENRDAHTPDW
jgi:hypothetical protein